MLAGGSSAILHELGRAVSGEDGRMINVQHSHDVIGIAAHHASISVHPPLLPPVQKNDEGHVGEFYRGPLHRTVGIGGR